MEQQSILEIAREIVVAANQDKQFRWLNGTRMIGAVDELADAFARMDTPPRVWQVTLKGYDGSTDATDDKIKWIFAHTKRDVKRYCDEKIWDEIAIDPTDINVDDHGVDANLTGAEYYIGGGVSSGKLDLPDNAVIVAESGDSSLHPLMVALRHWDATPGGIVGDVTMRDGTFYECVELGVSAAPEHHDEFVIRNRETSEKIIAVNCSQVRSVVIA